MGKFVSEAGLKISQENIQSVLDFPLPNPFPQTNEDFLGTVNYLGDLFLIILC